MKEIVIATCRKQPELTRSDELLRLELEARGATDLELIEPDLFLELAPAGPDILAEALVAAAETTPGRPPVSPECA